MIIFTIIVSVVVLLGAILLWAMYAYAELKGMEKALDEIEDMINEVRNESSDI